jgi:chromosome segregation ATPase
MAPTKTPAKKKKPTAEEAGLAWVKEQLAKAEALAVEKDRLHRTAIVDMQRLAEQLKQGEATMFANAAVVVELTQKLADLRKQLAAKDKELAADARAFAAIDGERTFLWEELDRFRDRLLDHIRWEMQLPEDARAALNKVRAQAFEDQLNEDAEEVP